MTLFAEDPRERSSAMKNSFRRGSPRRETGAGPMLGLSYRLRDLWNGRMTGFARLTRTVDRNSTMENHRAQARPAVGITDSIMLNAGNRRYWNMLHRIRHGHRRLWGNDGTAVPPLNFNQGAVTGVLWGNRDKQALSVLLVSGLQQDA